MQLGVSELVAQCASPASTCRQRRAPNAISRSTNRGRVKAHNHITRECNIAPECLVCTANTSHVMSGSKCSGTHGRPKNTKLNLNHCDAANSWLWQSFSILDRKYALLADPYHITTDNDNWIADKTRLAAVCTTEQSPVQEIVSTSHEGIAIAKINSSAGMYYCSCNGDPGGR